MSSPSSGGQSPANTLHDRYQKITEKIRQAAEKSARPVDSIRLMAVTKTVSVDRIQLALDLGINLIGENRVQEAEQKLPQISGRAEAHLIGALQTNKARKAVELFDVIQSVDRPKLAATLDRIAGELGKKQRCLIEVKVSDEETKSGVPLGEAEDFVKGFSGYRNLALEGLMTIGALNMTPDETRMMFRKLKVLFDKQKALFGPKPVLSMGMSEDFEVAIEEGSTLVRIGRALFGERA